MILTTCAACAAPLAHDAPRCVRCIGDLREAVETIEETKRTARRLLGGAHPIVAAIEGDLQDARATLQAREHSL
jgi:hypothetical protein